MNRPPMLVGQAKAEAPPPGPVMVSDVKLQDTVLRMRELLIDGGAELVPGHADAEESCDGDGTSALAAWEAFRAVAAEPANDPIRAWGEMQLVEDAGFMFEASWSEGWSKSPHNPRSRAMPEHYELRFIRQFAVGEDGDMKGLFLTIFVPAADELRELKGDQFFDGADAATRFMAAVEADPAFTVPMTLGRFDRYAFTVDGIG